MAYFSGDVKGGLGNFPYLRLARPLCGRPLHRIIRDALHLRLSVLPALIAKNLCREVFSMFLAAPASALAVGVAGFVVANHYDFPPAQVTVAFLCLLLAVAWMKRK